MIPLLPNLQIGLGGDSVTTRGAWVRDTTRWSYYLRDNLTCLYCGASYASGATLTLDHVIPREVGGGNGPENVVTACWGCNSHPASRPRGKQEQTALRKRLARARARNHLLPGFREVARMFEVQGAPEWVTELKHRAKVLRNVQTTEGSMVKAGRVVHVGSGQPYNIYIGRPGKGQEGYFGNPVVVGQTCQFCSEYHSTKGSTLVCFERHARERGEVDAEYRHRVIGLQGLILGCFCPPQGACHGYVLMDLAREWSGQIPGGQIDDLIPF